MRFKLEDPDHAYWVELHGVEVNDGYAEFPIKCTKLKDNKCTIYENRPGMCREFECTK